MSEGSRMQILSSTQSIIDYCQGLTQNQIVVNRNYQRSNKVWPDQARSFLIETMLLGYPIPKFFLYQTIDIKSRKSLKEIVDGQQRSTAIRDFYDDKLRISRNSEVERLAGRKFSELEEEDQGNFYNYPLAVDLLVATKEGEVREVFRRMNSYTVPLNFEEQRHADYQGPFKWFIFSLTGLLDKTLLRIGLFSEKNLIRMADAKLYSEVIHAMVNGIETTNKSKLDKLYEKFDVDFKQEDEFKGMLVEAFDYILSWQEIHNTALMKHYVVHSLILAIMHVEHNIPTLTPVQKGGSRLAERGQILTNLSQLSEALDNPESAPKKFADFISASVDRTNVRQQREVRFRWFCEALTAYI